MNKYIIDTERKACEDLRRLINCNYIPAGMVEKVREAVAGRVYLLSDFIDPEEREGYNDYKAKPYADLREIADKILSRFDLLDICNLKSSWY
jgi:hypothetical protein